MDRRLILVAIATLLVSSAFFIYQKFVVGPVALNVSIFPRDNIFTGETITFKDQTEGANGWVWSFGDGEYSTEQQGKHTYLSVGTYETQLTASGTFGTQQSRKFTVVVLPGKSKPANPEIAGESIVEQGKLVSYTSPVEAATMEWRLEGEAAYSGSVQKGKTGTWTLKTPGAKKLVLQTANPENLLTKEITVIEKAQVQVPVTPVDRPQSPPGKPHKPVRPKPLPDDEVPFNHGKGVDVKK